jgi:hypothetical protein
MGRWSEKWAETARLLRAELEPHLAPGEELIGAVHANRPKTFSASLFAVGVTPDRLIVLPIDKKMKAAGEPTSVTRDDITSAAIWGWGGSVRDFLSASSNYELRFETATEKYRFMTLGGTMLEDMLAGEDQLHGLDAVIEFLQSAKK